MNKTLLMTALLMFAGSAFPAGAVEQSAPVVTLVRVVALSAVGPDGEFHTLYRDVSGILTADRDLGRVLYTVRAGTLPEGGYHSLSAQLADEATAVYSDGRQEVRSLKAQGLPANRSIEGVLWVEGGYVQPLYAGRHRTTVQRRHGNDD